MNGLLKLSAVLFLACLLFLVVDVEHRATGYRAVHGQGIRGTVTVTGCEKHRTGTVCTGDFASADGRVTRSAVRINGATGSSGGSGDIGPVRLPSVLAAADADEAWTLDGVPWLRPSVVQLAALLPIAAAVILLRGLIRDLRFRRMRRRMGRGGMAMRMMSRRG